MIRYVLVAAVVFLLIHLGHVWVVGSLWSAQKTLLGAFLGVIIGVFGAWEWCLHGKQIMQEEEEHEV